MKIISITLVFFLAIVTFFVLFSPRQTFLAPNKETVINEAEVLYPININTADLELLNQIKGVGFAIAKDIITYRESNGSFNNINDLKNVSGIGDSRFENMKKELTV